jgi:hypothetical protein
MSRNSQVRGELDQLLREGVIDAPAHGQLAALYPTGKWDWRSLGRWFLIFGTIAAAAGAVILLRDVVVFTLWHLAALLAAALVGLFAGGWELRRRRWDWTGRAAELLGGFTLIGLSFTLGLIYSTGSGNWPALLLVDLVLLLALSYLRVNILLLCLSAVVFFTWFGGVTGYDSSWGAYWFGMNYPLRFLGAALVIAALGPAHILAEHGATAPYRGFGKVWLSTGLFLAEMALWLLSIFGNFGDIDGPWHEAEPAELLLFNGAWVLLNLALVYAGLRFAFRMVTGYGATFFIIQLYTLFFAHLAEELGWFASLVIAGGAALALAVWLESRRRAGTVKPA